MKTITLLVLTLFLAKGCGSTGLKKDSDNISIEYEALTRGAYNKIITKRDTVITIKDREMKNPIQRTLSNSDWNTILKLMSEINLETVANLKAPTKERFHDGAMMANITVIYRDKIYKSTTFDHGHPPKEIEKLVEKIIATSDLNK